MYVAVVRNQEYAGTVIGLSNSFNKIKSRVEEYVKTCNIDTNIDVYDYEVDKFYNKTWIDTYIKRLNQSGWVYTNLPGKFTGIPIQNDRDVIDEFCLAALHGDPVAGDGVRDVLQV